MSLLASPSNMNPSSRGHFFEVLKHSVMCSGGRMEYRCVVGQQFMPASCRHPLEDTMQPALGLGLKPFALTGCLCVLCRFLDVPSGVAASGRKGRPSLEDANARQAALDAAATEAAQAQGSKPDEPLLITISSLEQQTFEAGSIEAFGKAVQQSSSPRYLRPDGPAQPIFDAYIYPDTLLQFTVSAEKGAVKEELLEKYLLQLPERDKYYLDYVVSVAVIMSPPTGSAQLAAEVAHASRVTTTTTTHKARLMVAVGLLQVPAEVYPEFKAPALRRDALPRVGKTVVRVVKAHAAMQSHPVQQMQRLRPAFSAARVGRVAHVGWV